MHYYKQWGGSQVTYGKPRIVGIFRLGETRGRRRESLVCTLALGRCIGMGFSPKKESLKDPRGKEEGEEKWCIETHRGIAGCPEGLVMGQVLVGRGKQEVKCRNQKVSRR